MQNLLLEVIFFSCFSKEKALAIAVAIEDNEYPIEELVFDLVNLRAGHRFRSFNQSESRLSVVCRAAFGLGTVPDISREACLSNMERGSRYYTR